jgi:hypothetical protein
LVLSGIMALPLSAHGANKLCLQVIEKMVGRGNDKEKMLSCINPIMDEMEAVVVREKYRYEISKDTLLEMTPIYDNFHSVLDEQRRLTTEWEQIFSTCKKGPRNLLACADLELDLFNLYEKMREDLQLAQDKLKPACEKSESPDKDAYRKWLCGRVRATLQAQKVDWLRHLKERFGKYWTAQ